MSFATLIPNVAAHRIFVAEIGNYDPKRHSEDYVSEFYLVQNQTREVEDLIARCHRKLTYVAMQ